MGNERYERYRDMFLRRAKKQRSERKLLLDGIKNVPCMDCGGRFPPECMDFDHVRGKKLGTIGQSEMRHQAKHKLLAEVEKCDVVCSNCHRIRTASRLI